MDIKKAVKIVEQMENDVENLCKCCMPKGTCCIGCREMAITMILNELKKKDEVIKKIKITLKEQAIKIPTRIDDMTCEMKYTDEVVKVNQLLRILEDKE